MDTARVFLTAGEKSMAASAFPEAQFFLAKAICLIQDEDWSTDYHLCWDIYTKAADIASMTADFTFADKCLSVLFAHEPSLVGFLNASYIKVRSLRSKDDSSSLRVGIEALKMAGVTFPGQNFALHTIHGLAQTRKSMRGKTTDKLLQLPMLEDKAKIAALRLLNVLFMISISYDQKYLPFICFKLIQLNLKHGLSEFMPSALAVYGTILSRIGYPLAECAKYGEMALVLQEKLNANKEHMASVTLFTYGTFFNRTKRIADCRKHLKAGYDMGVKTGDMVHALACSTCVALCSFHSGQRLSHVAATLDMLRTSMLEHSWKRTIKGNRNYKQAVDYCRGQSRVFALEYSDFNLPMNEVSKLFQLVVACIFWEPDVAWEISADLHEFDAAMKGTVWPGVCAFYRGVSASSFFRVSRSRECIGLIKSCLKKLKKAQKKAPVNLTHQLHFLKAEFALCRHKYSVARKYYLLAVECAAIVGVTHEHAFACERLGSFYLLREKHEAAYEMIRESYRLYRTWGSLPKCEQLMRKFPRLDEKELVLSLQ
jgi:hypothetical protein